MTILGTVDWLGAVVTRCCDGGMTLDMVPGSPRRDGHQRRDFDRVTAEPGRLDIPGSFGATMKWILAAATGNGSEDRVIGEYSSRLDAIAAHYERGDYIMRIWAEVDGVLVAGTWEELPW